MKKITYITVVLLILFSSEIYSDWERVFNADSWLGYIFSDINCSDSNNCMAIAWYGGGSIVLKTTNGGDSWFHQFVDTVPFLHPDDTIILPKFKQMTCIDYVTPNFAVAGHKKGQLTITRDGGKTWDSIQLKTNTDQIYKVKFINEDYGIAYALNDIFRTYDAGYQWERINFSFKNNTSAIDMDIVGKDSLVLLEMDKLDGEKKIIRTSDGGNTFEFGNPIPVALNYSNISFIDLENGWISSKISNGNQKYVDRIIHTSDGGKTWVVQLDTLIYPEKGLMGIYFSDKNNGIAWGEFGKIWRTSNGGNNWYRDETLPGKITFIAFESPKKNAKELLAVRSYNEIWRYRDLESFIEIEAVNNFLYPNPASFFINTETYIGWQYQIYNILGSLIQAGTNISGQIKIENLPKGFYIIRFFEGDKQIIKKFFKN